MTSGINGPSLITTSLMAPTDFGPSVPQGKTQGRQLQTVADALKSAIDISQNHARNLPPGLGTLVDVDA